MIPVLLNPWVLRIWYLLSQTIIYTIETAVISDGALLDVKKPIYQIP